MTAVDLERGGLYMATQQRLVWRRRRDRVATTFGGQRQRPLCKVAELLGMDLEAGWIYRRGKQIWLDEGGMGGFHMRSQPFSEWKA
jgi:hypothetical protein